MMLAVQQYRDRIEAGQVLGHQLAHYASRIDTLVLGLPRGGVPVAIEVARYLCAPVDVFTVGSLRLPHDPEVSMGALAPGGVRVLDDETIEHAGVTLAEVDAIVARESAEIERRQRVYRGTRRFPPVAGRVVVLVDDGLATGLSMHAAVIAMHRLQPAWLVVAAPVGSVEACAELAQEVHEVVCPLRPEPFRAVGLCYEHFSPTDDEEVSRSLRKTRDFG